MNTQPPGYNPGESLLQGGNTSIQPVMGGGGGGAGDGSGDPNESLLSGGNSVNIRPLQGGSSDDKIYIKKKMKEKKGKGNTKSKRKTQKGGEESESSVVDNNKTIHDLNEAIAESNSYLTQLQSSLSALQQVPPTNEILSTITLVNSAIVQLQDTIQQASMHIAKLTTVSAAKNVVSVDPETSNSSGGGKRLKKKKV